MVKILKKFWVDGLICLLAIVSYIFAAKAEAFEAFYDFSRAHEDWDLDEIILVYAVAALVLPILLFRSRKRLKRAVQAVTAAEEHAQHVARHDALTGLFNRRHFSELLDAALRNATSENRPVVLLLDLDRFKAINDLRGHACGDRTLQEVAERIVQCCRDGDTPARLGGDEFAILLHDTPQYSASTSLARRLVNVIGEPIQTEGGAVTVGASIGICGWHEGATSAALVRNADQAMYKAKAEGRGRYAFYDDDLGEETRNQALMEEELRLAAQRDEIEPYFQPIVDIAGGGVIGFEVLSRWTSPTFGSVRPDIFIALAEDMGLIDTLTWQVMRKALKIANNWEPRLFVAFNLSPHLFNDALVKNITSQSKDLNFDPGRLEIEITEHAVIDNFDQAKHALNALKSMGIRISLDDFGTGFSSLATLSQLPFDKIKIDKSFITELHTRSQNAKIVGAILALANSLGLQVTAEGIETEEELGFLSQKECGQGQGYFFSRPMDAATASAFLEDETVCVWCNEIHRAS